jgi:hypothetical protein
MPHAPCPMPHAPCWLADGRPTQCHTAGPYHQAQIRFPSTNCKQWVRSNVFITLQLLLQVARSPSHSHSVLGSARPRRLSLLATLRSSLVLSCLMSARMPCALPTHCQTNSYCQEISASSVDLFQPACGQCTPVSLNSSLPTSGSSAAPTPSQRPRSPGPSPAGMPPPQTPSACRHAQRIP